MGGLGEGPLGLMPLGDGEILSSLISNPVSNVFRRLQIKRRQTSNGLFEANWQNITSYVKQWGIVERSIDDVRLNRFQNSGFSVKVRNDTGAFNLETNPNSIWNGYLTRQLTLVRVQAGYYDISLTEYPADSTLGVFVMDQEMPIEGDTNDVTMNCSSLQSIFDNVPASDIGGIRLTLTSADIIAKIRDHTDGAGTFIFRQFITSTSWGIQSTSTHYFNPTSTSLDGLSTWDLMVKLAEAESFVLYITLSGGIEFSDRVANTTSSQFSFYGQGFPRQNVIKLNAYREAVDKYYTYFRFQWQNADTTTSFVSAGTTTTVSPTNIAWRSGSRTYELNNELVQDTTTAQTIVNNLFTQLGSVGVEAVITTKFIPQLEILDAIDVSYHSYDMAGQTLWDVGIWDTDVWATEGENFDWDGLTFKNLGVRHDLSDFTSEFSIRRT